MELSPEGLGLGLHLRYVRAQAALGAALLRRYPTAEELDTALAGTFGRELDALANTIADLRSEAALLQGQSVEELVAFGGTHYDQGLGACVAVALYLDLDPADVLTALVGA